MDKQYNYYFDPDDEDFRCNVCNARSIVDDMCVLCDEYLMINEDDPDDEDFEK